MIKPQKLNKGDKIAIVSLSRGLLGMPFCKYELVSFMEGFKNIKELLKYTEAVFKLADKER